MNITLKTINLKDSLLQSHTLTNPENDNLKVGRAYPLPFDKPQTVSGAGQHARFLAKEYYPFRVEIVLPKPEASAAIAERRPCRLQRPQAIFAASKAGVVMIKTQ